jgi:hypothetical protein
MKKYISYLVVALLLIALLSACIRTQSTPPPEAMGPSPTPEVLTQLPDAIASQTAAPTPVEAVPTQAPPTPTEAAAVPTDEPTVEPPTDTPETPKNITLVPKDQPTATPTPTAIPPGETFDPTDTYGLPTFKDPMNSGSYGNWKSDGRLPNTELIQISLEGNNMYVTGKKPGFSTWYFSWPTLTDFYIQMEVKTEECSGKDEYGLIVRGPAHGAGVSYGYIMAFSCDGYYRLTRLDSADPYSAIDLVPATKSTYIETGADQKNVVAIRAVGKTLTIFANGYQLAEVNDATFSKGRYGVFVQAVDTYNYTYHPVQIVYWDLAE